MLVLPPRILPEVATLDEVLSAANALERVGKLQEANIAYQSILKKWPENVFAFFGLGNTFASLKKYQESIRAFEHALMIEPNSNAVLNNLAEVKHKLKKKH